MTKVFLGLVPMILAVSLGLASLTSGEEFFTSEAVDRVAISYDDVAAEEWTSFTPDIPFKEGDELVFSGEDAFTSEVTIPFSEEVEPSQFGEPSLFAAEVSPVEEPAQDGGFSDQVITPVTVPIVEPDPGYVVVYTIVSPSMDGFSNLDALLSPAQQEGAYQLTVQSVKKEETQGKEKSKDKFSADVDFSKREEAVAFLREKMVNREPEVSFSYKVKGKPQEMETVLSFAQVVLLKAMEHTGKGKEGDYLLWNYKESNWVASYEYDGKATTYTYTYQFHFFTTKEEEELVDLRLEEVYKELHLSSLSDYEKVRVIYDYVLDHTEYDVEHLKDAAYTKKFTAYAALLDHKAVCQGYGNLLYRMLLDNGIDCRCIPGMGKTPQGTDGHLWNIIALDGKYYNADVTWDDQEVRSYQYFLREEDFFAEEHFRDAEFMTKAFGKSYPIGESAYAPGREIVVEETTEGFIEAFTEGYTEETTEEVKKAALEGEIQFQVG